MSLAEPCGDLGEAAWLARLAGGVALEVRAAVVAAHPDDETLGFGVGMTRLADLTLIHVTDGAPSNMADARRAGFRSRSAYAEARVKELDAALAVLGVVPNQRLRYGVRDQQASERLADLTRRLASDLTDFDLVITHPYEGGHPDHDAAAFAVQTACVLLARSARTPPRRWEFAGYHKADGQARAGRFAPARFAPEHRLAMSADDATRRGRAMACFETQLDVLTRFGAPDERVRRAPVYDFTRPPPPGAALYDDWGWPVTAALWRDRARAAQRELGL
jgi:LmbE family N-acetylglucosaminyl deacetylase